jgi:predicted ATPase
VFGEVPNLAARVQDAAEPGTVLVTSSVQRQIAGLFIVEDTGAHELKGVPAPVTLYRVLRISGGPRRKGARLLTPFIGREEDIGVLARCWERARAGKGQFVLIVGQPGIGKSRLIQEFRAGLGETPHSWIEWSSSQLLQNTPLHPVLGWGRTRFGGPEVAPERRLAELESVLTHVKLNAAEHAPLVAPFVDTPVPPERLPSLPPDEVHRRQLAAMVEWVLAGARNQPVVLVVEDLQWFDPTSIDLVHALSDRGAQAPLLILATARPEFWSPWSLRPHHSVISLTPLDDAQVQRMVADLASQRTLSPEVIKGVSERAGGVPLFVEEVTRLLLERGEQGGAKAIPPTLRQSLAARLDRLGSAREVAQIGAVLGRGFSYAVLRDVVLESAAGDHASSVPTGYAKDRELDEVSLQSALDRLIGADLLFVEGAPPEASYRFKHALIQDAAYENLLKSRRQTLHRRAAEALIEANQEPEAVARHFTEARLDDRAIEWWSKAGDLALRRSAFKEAIAHLGKAIEMTEALAGAGDADTTGAKLKLQVAYGNAMIAAHGHGAPETLAAFRRAHKLGADAADVDSRFSSNYGLWAGSYVHGDLPGMLGPAQAFLDDVELRPGSPEAGVAHRAYGVTQWFTGNYSEACAHLEQAVAIFDPERDRDLAFRFGQDVGVSATVYLAIALWPLGQVDRAREIADATATRIAKLSHLATSTYGLMHCAMFEIIGRKVDRAAPLARALSSVAHEHRIALWVAFGAFLEAWVELRSGVPDIGLTNLRRAAALLQRDNVGAFQPLVRTALAEAEARNGETTAALATLDHALEDFESSGQRWFDAEIDRMRGEILLEQNPADRGLAEDAFLSSIAVARHQKARSFELRAALALAKLYQSSGRPVDADAVLAPALEGFAPTPEMPEIAEAQALLAAVNERPKVN